MKKVFGVILVAISCVSIESCEEIEPIVVIYDVIPRMGTADQMVYISGSGFDSKSIVKFNGVEATVLESTLDRLIVKVPVMTSGPIELISKGKASVTNFSFEYFEPSGSWAEKNEFPGSDRRYSLCVSVGDVGIVGMGHSSDYLKDVWKYTPSSDSWAQVSDFPGQFTQVLSSFVIEDDVFVIVDSAFYSHPYKLWKYNVTADLWTEMAYDKSDLLDAPLEDPSIPFPRIVPTTPRESNGLVAVRMEHDWYDYSWYFKRYDSSNNSWSTTGLAPPYMFSYYGVSGSLMTEDAVYMASYDSLRKVDLSTYQVSREVMPRIPVYSSGFSFQSSNGNLYFGLGGELNGVWGYSLSTHNWFPAMPSPALRIGENMPCPMFAINDKLYVLFGRDENGPTKKVMEFTP